jgi:hypothetical protein
MNGGCPHLPGDAAFVGLILQELDMKKSESMGSDQHPDCARQMSTSAVFAALISA